MTRIWFLTDFTGGSWSSWSWHLLNTQNVGSSILPEITFLLLKSLVQVFWAHATVTACTHLNQHRKHTLRNTLLLSPYLSLLLLNNYRCTLFLLGMSKDHHGALLLTGKMIPESESANLLAISLLDVPLVDLAALSSTSNKLVRVIIAVAKHT
jgi:hypothetical protein